MSQQSASSGKKTHVIVVGAGLGGLASSVEIEGFSFDTGPYLLLDRPGLGWAFAELGLEIDQCLDLLRLEKIYSVSSPQNPTVYINASLDDTVARLNTDWARAGERLSQAPSPLLFLPALMHSVGAFYPRGGLGAIARVLTAECEAAGVTFSYGREVTHICHKDG